MRRAAARAALLALALVTSPAAASAVGPGTGGPESRTRGADAVLVASRDLRTSLDQLLALLEEDARRAERDACATSELFADGSATRQDVERAASALAEARARVDETRRRIDEVEDVIAEASVERPRAPAAEIATARVRPAIMRNSGAPGWTLAELWRVRAFYAARFGRELPVSALGQTAVHDRLGFDHRNAFDVAVRPDSPEGLALVTYLRSENIPFIAFSGPVPGKATGAHIHVGYPSHRL